MSASVKYWRLPEEERDFIDFLGSLEPTLAIAPGFHSGAGNLRWQSLEEAFASGGDSYLIAPSCFLPQMRTVHSKGTEGEGSKISVVASPTVFYYRGRMIAPNRLSASALSADWTFLAEDGRTLEDKPAEFVRWAKKVMQWVRKQAPGWHQHKAHRITAKAEAARLRGLELVS